MCCRRGPCGDVARRGADVAWGGGGNPAGTDTGWPLLLLRLATRPQPTRAALFARCLPAPISHSPPLLLLFSAAPTPPCCCFCRSPAPPSPFALLVCPTSLDIPDSGLFPRLGTCSCCPPLPPCCHKKERIVFVNKCVDSAGRGACRGSEHGRRNRSSRCLQAAKHREQKQCEIHYEYTV
jgi:hypothetical protein